MAMQRPVCTTAFSIESLISGPGPGLGSGPSPSPFVYSYPMFVPYRSVLLPPPLPPPPPHGYGMTLTSAVFPPGPHHEASAGANTRKYCFDKNHEPDPEPKGFLPTPTKETTFNEETLHNNSLSSGTSAGRGGVTEK